MKQKLKLLFAFLRGLKGHLVDTSITMDRHYIDDFRGFFEITNKDKHTKKLKLPQNLENIIRELIDKHMSDFDKYLIWDYDDYWFLYIDIYPFENKIVFTSSCKTETEDDFEYEFHIDQVSSQTADAIESIYEDEPELTKFEFDFWGRWGDGETHDLELDGKLVKINSDIELALWNITNEIMKKITSSRFWNEGPGVAGSVTVWDENIFVKGNIKEEEYMNTNMNFEINLETYENEKEI